MDSPLSFATKSRVNRFYMRGTKVIANRTNDEGQGLLKNSILSVTVSLTLLFTTSCQVNRVEKADDDGRAPKSGNVTFVLRGGSTSGMPAILDKRPLIEFERSSSIRCIVRDKVSLFFRDFVAGKTMSFDVPAGTYISSANLAPSDDMNLKVPSFTVTRSSKTIVPIEITSGTKMRFYLPSFIKDNDEPIFQSVLYQDRLPGLLCGF